MLMMGIHQQTINTTLLITPICVEEKRMRKIPLNVIIKIIDIIILPASTPEFKWMLPAAIHM